MAKNSRQQWLLKPGEAAQREGVGALVDKLIEEYSLTTNESKSLCLNDNNETIYFIGFPDEDSQMTSAEVAILDGDKFVFLPKELAFNLAQAYINHVKFIGEAYDWVAEQEED